MNQPAVASLPEETQARLLKLTEVLTACRNAAVAFSGGVDSTLLLAACASIPSLKVLAVTCDSEFMPSGDLERAAAVAERLGVGHVVVRINPLADPTVAENPADRCYHCKKLTFATCLRVARERGCFTVFDGRIADDDHDWRPGTRAATELGIASPMHAAGLTKDDVRTISRDVFNLSEWDRASGACLASRFPAGSRLTASGLEQVRRVEDLLHSLGFKLVRARHFGDLVKIEVGDRELTRLCDPSLTTEIVVGCRAAGFHTVVADLEPYRMGRLNEGIAK